MSNIIDTIQVSGVTYTIAGSGGGSGNSVVEVTQAQYDAMVSGGTVDPTILYIITDAQAGDLTQYWTSAQTQSAITEATSGKVDTSDFNTYSASVETALSGKVSQSDFNTYSASVETALSGKVSQSDFNTYSASVETALSGKASQSDLETVSGQVANKQDTLVSGTNIKTINNESLLGSGNIIIQGGGGGTITIDPSLDSGSTNAVANSAITEAVNSKVNIADNNVSGFTYETSLKNQYNYSDEFAGPIYVKYGGDSSISFTDRYAGDVTISHDQHNYLNVILRFDVLNGAITATSTESSDYYTITIQDGEAIVTPSSGCYFVEKARESNYFVFFRKIVYSSGQSANVIENTVYPMFGNLKDDLGNAVGEVGLHTTGRGGIGVIYTSINGTRVTGNDVQLASSTIYMDNEGKLNTQFATPQSSQKVLNTGQYNYCYLFNYLDYSDAYDDLTITFNPEGYEGGDVSFNFNLTFVKNYNTTSFYSFTYSTTTSGLTYWDSSLDNYCTKDDTISTDYKLKITAKDGYKINTFRSTNCSIGGVDAQYPEDYIVTLVTTTSNVQNGQNVIDDIYSTLSGKQDTLSAGTGIDITNNVISATGGGGGGKAISAGTNISVTTGETADTINCTVPASASSGNYSIMFGQPSSSGDASGSKTITGGQWSKAYGEGSVAIGQMNESRSSWAWAIGNGTSAVGQSAFACGEHNSTKNPAEFTCGYATITSGGSDTSLMTLFTVGNGKYQGGYQRHNALDVRMNGDIYISDTNSTSTSNYWEKPMIKLQDALGGKVDTSAMSGYVTTDTAQEITGEKTFVGEKKLKFKQSAPANKIGFTLYNSASTNNELATFEFRPNTYTVSNVNHPLLYLGHYRSTAIAGAGVPQTVVGFRQYDQANSAAYHLFAPLPEEAKTPFSLTTSFQNYFIPLGFKVDSSTMVKTDNTGVVDLTNAYYTKTEINSMIGDIESLLAAI